METSIRQSKFAIHLDEKLASVNVKVWLRSKSFFIRVTREQMTGRQGITKE